MAALASSLVLRPVAFTQQQRGAARQGRRLQRCYAAAEEDKQRSLDFTSNKRSGLGFTENDSAGQTNIFAVEPKTYVAGSSADGTSSGSQATLIVAGIAAVGAAAAVAGGLLANSTTTTSIEAVTPSGDFKTLTAYSKQFAAELAPAPAAPALADQ